LRVRLGAASVQDVQVDRAGLLTVGDAGWLQVEIVALAV